MPRRRQAVYCSPGLQGGAAPSQRAPISDFTAEVLLAVEKQGVVASLEEQMRFAAHLDRSTRQRKAAAWQWAKNRKTDDIIGLIQIARDSGDLDEAAWRCFLAAHFGRASAGDDENVIHTASRFLCAFKDQPYWIWQKVSTNRESLRKWLLVHRSDLQTLVYGNHRKYEAKTPEVIWSVLESFFARADEFDGPLGLISSRLPEPCTPEDVFDELFRRFKTLFRFRRLGAFDFLALLIDLKMILAVPASCYLEGSTGPLKGAIKLWGKRPTKELDRLAVELAEQLGASPMALEDALCNWQKHAI